MKALKAVVEQVHFGYRKTNLFGFGATILNKYFTLRFDIANFETKDKNKSM